MRVLLDTDVLSTLLKGPPESRLRRRLRAVPLGDRYISSITAGEMLYGFERCPRHGKLRDILEREWFPYITVVSFDLPAARVYGRLRAALERAGAPLAEPDLRIAAIALANELTLITGNERHFARVEGLRVENWLG